MHRGVQRLLQETLSSRLAWQRGMLVFDGEPLEAALAEVSRYTDVRFGIRDDNARGVQSPRAADPAHARHGSHWTAPPVHPGNRR